MKAKLPEQFKFVGRSADGQRYIWEAIDPDPRESRGIRITCGVEWFWRAPAGALERIIRNLEPESFIPERAVRPSNASNR